MIELSGAVINKILASELLTYAENLARYREGAQAVLQQLQAGLRTHIDTSMPLQEVAMAHRRLQSGKSLGALLLKS